MLQHFVNENKDRSIFRKNIGRVLLNRDEDPYLIEWEHDRTSRADRISGCRPTYAATHGSVEFCKCTLTPLEKAGAKARTTD